MHFLIFPPKLLHLLFRVIIIIVRIVHEVHNKKLATWHVTHTEIRATPYIQVLIALSFQNFYNSNITSVTHTRYAKLVTHFIRRPLRSYAVTHFIPDRILHLSYYTMHYSEKITENESGILATHNLNPLLTLALMTLQTLTLPYCYMNLPATLSCTETGEGSGHEAPFGEFFWQNLIPKFKRSSHRWRWQVWQANTGSKIASNNKLFIDWLYFIVVYFLRKQK